MKTFLFLLLISFAGAQVYCQHLGFSGGANLSNSYYLEPGISWQGGVTYEQKIKPWFSVSTGGIYNSLVLYGAAYSHGIDPMPRPDKTRYIMRMIEIPVLLHFTPAKNEKGTWAMGPHIGYSYVMGLSSYSQTIFDEGPNGAVLKASRAVPNTHIFNFGWESRHRVQGKYSLSYGIRYRYMHNVSRLSQVALDNVMLYVMLGMDFSRKREGIRPVFEKSCIPDF